MADKDVTQSPGRRARDRSMVILIVGVALMMPPIGTVVLMDELLFGLPLPLLYIFVVWAGLIIGAALISGPLRDSETKTPNPTGGRPSDGTYIPPGL